MDPMLPIHIVAGSLGIGSGFVALYSAKGAPLHRKAGKVFVYVMLTMAFTGLVLAVARNATPAINVPASLITAYLVVTALTTVRPPATRARGLQFAATLVAFTVGLVSLAFGFEALASGGEKDEIPAFPFFLFGAIGVLGSVGDLRMLRSGPPHGVVRITRHLWRMCLALFIAVMSFFLGQADEIPEPIRIPGLLALPIVAVVLTMLYWLWRVRIRRSFRGVAGGAAKEAP